MATEILKYDSSTSQWVNASVPESVNPYTGVWVGGYGGNGLDTVKYGQAAVVFSPTDTVGWRSIFMGDANTWIGADPQGRMGFKPGASGIFHVTLTAVILMPGAPRKFRVSIWSQDGGATKVDFPMSEIVSNNSHEQPVTVSAIFQYTNNGTGVSFLEIGNDSGQRYDYKYPAATVRRLNVA